MVKITHCLWCESKLGIGAESLEDEEWDIERNHCKQCGRTRVRNKVLTVNLDQFEIDYSVSSAMRQIYYIVFSINPTIELAHGYLKIDCSVEQIRAHAESVFNSFIFI
jgi:hypothetical protein